MSVIPSSTEPPPSVLDLLHAPTRAWFEASFEAPTVAQVRGWPAIAAGDSTLLLAPTGSGKTLAAFLVALDRLAFGPPPAHDARGVAPGVARGVARGVRVLYVSPLRALGVDVERNLRAPLAGLSAAAERLGVPHRVPTVGVRSGDTPPAERRRLVRHPPEILITTPESLYLMLTSAAADTLRTVETVIVDEIHAVAGTKRGTHLFLSLERLEEARRALGGGDVTPLQRIGLSATQRPLDEIARLLGGGERDRAPDAPFRRRAVEIVDAGRQRPLQVTIEVTVDDMSRIGEAVPREVGPREPSPGDRAPKKTTIWTSVHPRLVELIRAHRTTIVFTNSRRLAERLTGAINDEAGEEIALAHHGSIAKDLRLSIEERLKKGEIPAIVATSSLELGIDMGAVDLVIQIEAPISVASGVQRIGRAGHQVGAVSRGIVIPKHRHDLLTAAAAVGAMTAGRVEETHYPRNPLDVLAQQIVAIVAQGSGTGGAGGIAVDALFALVRRAAPFSELQRGSFEGVLDLLSGRYPSEHFGDLRPRVTWDRIQGTLTPRRGARHLAVLNAGTIPDRGLYGVFLAGTDKPVRVGELDEEMVFETLAGEVFLLGATAWRVEEITHDRVTVTPAPGELGRMPFWRGDRPGRPAELGRAVGQLTARLLRGDTGAAETAVRAEIGLDASAARNLVAYVRDQRDATGEAPTHETLVIERFTDEVGDWCVCVHSPFGGRVHAPWAMAIQARLRREAGIDAQTLWTDDGIVVRFPESDEPPATDLFLPASADIDALVVRRLADTSLFAARFRENAVRALLLPRRDPRRRRPLWVQRRKAADLLQVAAEFADFPMILETYRECLRDVFDLPALRELLRGIEQGAVRVHVADTLRPSPFAASLLFSYVGNFLYEDDQPLAERRAVALALDHGALRALLGEPELRELLDAAVIRAEEARLQRLDGRRPIRHADALHDALLSLGPLSRDEVGERSDAPGEVDAWADELIAARRITEISIGGARRLGAVEDTARFRDALGVVPPDGLPDVFLASVPDPLGDLVARHARNHGPFRTEDIATRLGVGAALVRDALIRLAAADRVVDGEFLPGGRGVEWVSVEVLRRLKQRSLAALRAEIEPVEHAALARFSLNWHGINWHGINGHGINGHGIARPMRGMDGVLAAIERFQGAAVPVSDLEDAILPVRVHGFDPRDLDLLCTAGEIVWRGAGAIGARDGRVVLYLTDHAAALALPAEPLDGELHSRIRELLGDRGALFFADLVDATGAFKPDLVASLYDLVWNGEVTNDTLAPLRSRRAGDRTRKRLLGGRAFRSRRIDALPGTEGRWSLFRTSPFVSTAAVSPTDRAAALACQLLLRHGLVCRETIRSEDVRGGFSVVYPVLRAMEEAGRVRRGYFVEGLGASQFAQPGAEERLRQLRDAPDTPGTGATAQGVHVLAATDPAQPYGAVLPWPGSDASARPQRAAGARCVLHHGRLVAHLSRGGGSLLTFLPDDPAERGHAATAVVSALAALSRDAGLSITRIDGREARESPLADALRSAGFAITSQGLSMPRERRRRGDDDGDRAKGGRHART